MDCSGPSRGRFRRSLIDDPQLQLTFKLVPPPTAEPNEGRGGGLAERSNEGTGVVGQECDEVFGVCPTANSLHYAPPALLRTLGAYAVDPAIASFPGRGKLKNNRHSEL